MTASRARVCARSHGHLGQVGQVPLAIYAVLALLAYLPVPSCARVRASTTTKGNYFTRTGESE
jgi:hypothetical protein